MGPGCVVFLVAATLVVAGVSALNPAVRGCPDRIRSEGESKRACRANCYFSNRDERWVEAYFMNGTECESQSGAKGTCEGGFCITGETTTKKPKKEKPKKEKPKKEKPKKEKPKKGEKPKDEEPKKNKKPKKDEKGKKEKKGKE